MPSSKTRLTFIAVCGLAVLFLTLLIWPRSAGAEGVRDELSTSVADRSDDADPVVLGAGALLLATGTGIAVSRHRRLTDAAEREAAVARASVMEPLLFPEPMRTIYVDDGLTVTEVDGAVKLTINPADPPVQPEGARLREIDLHQEPAETNLARTLEKMQLTDRVSVGLGGSVLSREEFARHVHIEFSRHHRGGRDGAIASLVLSELDAVQLRLGGKPADELFQKVTAEVRSLCRPLDVVGLIGPHELAILMPDIDEEEGRTALDFIAMHIASMTFMTHGERVLLTPATGYALLSDTGTTTELIQAVGQARSMSMLNQHLRPERWDVDATPLDTAAVNRSRWSSFRAKLRTPIQIAATFVLAWILPFIFYVAMDAIGLDISFAAFLFFVGSLAITGGLILIEGLMALKQKEPPAEPSIDYPRASALIAAYLPNEAGTVIETVEAFLQLDYPNDVQIILAYNTPERLPVEDHLDRLAAEHPNFFPVRVVGSNSKAQNVNAALHMADGAFVGMFDADHQPRPDAYTRAWRWIDSGYDVVQGHCLTRNGDANWLAKMVAVEFEAIYAVSHPGRAKMHQFGVFGGSNGFWRRELLHETRMRGSMLTEDIDSSMRVIERGYKIRSDRDLVSRELATTTFRQVWNQRMRWAQGWFQVSLHHIKLAMRSDSLTIRQKIGVFHLLVWREIYPWLSQQLFPLLAFWAVQAGGIGRLDWTVPIFVATSLFTLSVGPLQTLFAYRLADEEIKQHKRWFWGYLVFSTVFYTEYKNLIARVAQVKELMGESDWRVTPRSEDPV